MQDCIALPHTPIQQEFQTADQMMHIETSGGIVAI